MHSSKRTKYWANGSGGEESFDTYEEALSFLTWGTVTKVTSRYGYQPGKKPRKKEGK